MSNLPESPGIFRMTFLGHFFGAVVGFGCRLAFSGLWVPRDSKIVSFGNISGIIFADWWGTEIEN